MSTAADETYARAAERWPEVGWPRAEFVSHLQGQAPPYGVDLFLAGAAGVRLKAAWARIEADIGPAARAVFDRQPKADCTAEDLWAETVARLIDEQPDEPPLADGRRPARIVRYRGLVSLANYMILVGRRLAIQRHRRPGRMASTDAPAGGGNGGGGGGGGDDDGPAHDVRDDRAGSPSARLEDAEAVAELGDALQAAFAALSSERKFLIVMVYRQGLRQKEAGARLGWNESKTSRALSQAMGELRRALCNAADTPWTPTVAAAWEQFVQRSWTEVQVPAPVASV